MPGVRDDDPTPSGNPWDIYAAEYIAWLAKRQPVPVEDGGIPSRLLELTGDVHGRDILDAGCGEGFLARILQRRGARVTGIDLSPRLIEHARRQDTGGAIDYRVGDLSTPQADLDGAFDAVGSYLVLNDVDDYRGFATTLFSVLKPGGRAVLAFNNPYSSVVREHIDDYFASGSIGRYGGLASQGVKAHYYHRTLEDYVDAFLRAGFLLTKLADVADRAGLDWVLPPAARFPRFMVLAFERPRD